jgi:hypothetical protein
VRMKLKNLTMSGLCLAVTAGQAIAAESTNLYWGDTHLHTSYSFILEGAPKAVRAMRFSVASLLI